MCLKMATDLVDSCSTGKVIRIPPQMGCPTSGLSEAPSPAPGSLGSLLMLLGSKRALMENSMENGDLPSHMYLEQRGASSAILSPN